jgi:agmatinase
MVASKLKLCPAHEGFLGLEKEHCNWENSKVVVIPFGLEASVSYEAGTAKAPQAIITASHQVELFDEILMCEPYEKLGVATFEPQTIKHPVTAALNQLEETVEYVLESKKFPLVLGGEHTIVAGSIRPFVKRHQDLCILHFDAHADLRAEYKGDVYSHAAALRRCMDHPNIQLFSYAIRNISAGEMEYYQANRDRINIFWAHQKNSWDIQATVDKLKGKAVYISFDVDAFDTSLMPATGTPEPGGIFWDEAINIIHEVSKVANIVGADVNELSPKANLHGCDFLAAKLAYKIISFAHLKELT